MNIMRRTRPLTRSFVFEKLVIVKIVKIVKIVDT